MMALGFLLLGPKQMQTLLQHIQRAKAQMQALGKEGTSKLQEPEAKK